MALALWLLACLNYRDTAGRGNSDRLQNDFRSNILQQPYTFLIDLLLTSYSDEYQVFVRDPLGSSDYYSVRTIVPNMRHVRPRSACCRRVWHYRLADWVGYGPFLHPIHRPRCASRWIIRADTIAEVVLQGMELFSPFSTVPIGGKSQPWFGYYDNNSDKQNLI